MKQNNLNRSTQHQSVTSAISPSMSQHRTQPATKSHQRSSSSSEKTLVRCFSKTKDSKLTASSRMMEFQDAQKSSATKVLIQKIERIDKQFKQTLVGLPPRNDKQRSRNNDEKRTKDSCKQKQRFYESRNKEDSISGRTINTQHSYYETQDYTDSTPKTNGSRVSSVLKASKPPQIQQIPQPRNKPKPPPIINRPYKLTGESKKRNELSFKSSFKLSYNTQELNQTDRQTPTIRLNSNIANVLFASKCKRKTPQEKGNFIIGSNPYTMRPDPTRSNIVFSSSKVMKKLKDFGSQIAGLSGSTVDTPKNRQIHFSISSQEVEKKLHKNQLSSLEKQELGLAKNAGHFFAPLKHQQKNISHLNSSFEGLNFSSIKDKGTPASQASHRNAKIEDTSFGSRRSSSKGKNSGYFKSKCDAFRSNIQSFT